MLLLRKKEKKKQKQDKLGAIKILTLSFLRILTIVNEKVMVIGNYITAYWNILP